MTIEKTAVRYANDCDIYSFDEITMRKALEKQGFLVLEFKDLNDVQSKVPLIIDTADAVSRNAFVYCIGEAKYAFVKENLACDEKAFALATLLGHIALGHKIDGVIEDKDSKTSIDAVCFASYIRSFCFDNKLITWVKRHRSESLLLGVFAVTVISSIVLGVGTYFSVFSNVTDPRIAFSNAAANVVINNDDVYDLFNEETVPAFSSAIIDGANDNENDFEYSQKENVTDEQTENEYKKADLHNFYFMTKNGTKYHTADCSYIRDVSACNKVTAEEIIKNGYEACKRCVK